MKRILLSIAIIVSLQSQGKAQVKLPKSDTINTLLLYEDPIEKKLKHDFGFRVIADVVKLVQIDANTFKKKTVVDTFYYVPVYKVQLDSISKKPKLDTADNPIFRIDYTYVPTSTIYMDAGKNIAAVIKKYEADKLRQQKNK
jgi:hypothetical protein